MSTRDSVTETTPVDRRPPEKIIAAGIAVTWWYASKLPAAEHDAQADKTAAEIMASLKRAGFTFRRRKTQ